MDDEQVSHSWRGTTMSRITIIGPRTRIDVALPSGLTLAELMPRVLSLAQIRPAGTDSGLPRWRLARVGDVALDADRSLASHQVRDGEILLLHTGAHSLPSVVHDDPAILVASAAGARWTRRNTELVGLSVVGVSLPQAALSIGALPSEAAIPTAAAVLVALVLLAAALSRGGSAGPAALIIGSGALPTAVVLGLRLASAGPDPADYLGAAAALAVTGLLAGTVMKSGRAAFAAAATIGAVGCLGFGFALATSSSWTAVAAVVIVVSVAGLQAAPRAALRWAGIPVLVSAMSSRSPTGSDQSAPAPASASAPAWASGTESDRDPAELRRRAVDAAQRLTGVAGGLSGTAGVAALALTASASAWSLALAGIGVSAVVIGSRSFRGAAQVLAVTAPALIAAVAGLVVMMADGSVLRPDRWPAVWLGLAGIGCAVGGLIPGPQCSPTTRRAVDALEAALMASLLPVAFAALDLYRMVRHI